MEWKYKFLSIIFYILYWQYLWIPVILIYVPYTLDINGGGNAQQDVVIQ